MVQFTSPSPSLVRPLGVLSLLLLSGCATEGTFLDPDVFMPYARELLGSDSLEARPEFSGLFNGSIEGQPAEMELVGIGLSITGTALAGGQAWTIEGEIDGLAARGEMVAENGAVVPFAVMPTSEGLFFELTLTNPQSGSVSQASFGMQRVVPTTQLGNPFGFPQQASIPRSPNVSQVLAAVGPGQVSLDPNVVGGWERAETLADGTLTAHELFVVQPDGNFAVMTQTAEGSYGVEGLLATSENVIYLRGNQPGAEFAPWASYRLEEGRLISVDNDGVEQVWQPAALDGASSGPVDSASSPNPAPLNRSSTNPVPSVSPSISTASAEWSGERGPNEKGEPQFFADGYSYAAGIRVNHEPFGVSFVVPEGCELSYEYPWGAAALATPHEGVIANTWIMNGVTPDQLAQWLASSTSIGDTEDARLADSRVDQNGGVYVELRSPDRVAYGVGRVAPGGGVLCIYTYGPQSQSGSMKSTAEEVLASLRTKSPTTRAVGIHSLKWHGEVWGYRMRQLSSYSSSTPGGGGYSSDYALDLCMNGTYYSSASDTTSFGSSSSGVGTNGYVHTGGDHAGMWYVDAWGTHGATLVLTRRDGAVVNQNLYIEYGEMYMNGARAYVVNNERCP